MMNETTLREALTLAERAHNALTTAGLKSPGLAESKLRKLAAPTPEEIAEDILNSTHENPLYDPALQSKFIAMQISRTAPTYLVDLEHQRAENLQRFREAKTGLVKKIRANITTAAEQYVEASTALNWQTPDLTQTDALDPDVFAHQQQRLLAQRAIRENLEAWNALEQAVTGVSAPTGLYLDAPFLFFTLTTAQGAEAVSAPKQGERKFDVFEGLRRGYTFDLAATGQDAANRRAQWDADYQAEQRRKQDDALFGNRPIVG